MKSMANGPEGPTPPREVIEYYDGYPEETRLDEGPFRLERERTREILTRVLPPPPARVVDVGGAAGAYSAWLAARGYAVHLVDASPRLIAEARRHAARWAKAPTSMQVADARRLPQQDGAAEAVLVMGPLYHLTEPQDRAAALREARRVLTPGGVVAVAAISRYASSLDGLSRRLTRDPRFVEIRDRDVREGRHRNDTGHPSYFTTAYFHRPDELRAEVEGAGFADVAVLGVEGPGWLLPDFEERWADEALRHDLLETARLLESEAAIVGASAHLMAIGRRA
jgi:ubiquinone/menaquinone biosynthesis C-methylase UbiE